jgi:hypothetical protein
VTGRAFQLRDGQLTRDTQPFVVRGVVYHSPGAGPAMWRADQRAELASDFAAMAAAGFNTVRLFLYWRDAQPAEHEISASVLRRLRDCVDQADQQGLACLISLLTIFMNGELLDVPWRNGRDLWRDPGLLAAQERYVRAVAAELAGCPNVLGFDLGDEIASVVAGPAALPSAAEVADWYKRMRSAIRDQAPGVLVCQANNATAVFGRAAFNVANSAPLDLNAIHGYPTWSAGSIESARSVKATNLVPFLAAVAGAYRPSLIDELACYGTSDEVAAGYLGAAAVSAVANGATGFIVWCWQDLSYLGEPFGERPLERFMGLLRCDGSAKPTMAAVSAALGTAGELGRADRGAVALYLPERLLRGQASYLDSEGGAIATFYAYLLLKRAHLHFDIVTGRLDAYQLVICPGPGHLTATDQDRLAAAARGGATVYLSLGDALHGFPGAELTGACPVDFDLRPAHRGSFEWGGLTWPLNWGVGLLPALTVSAPAESVLAAFPDGSPALVRHGLGAGTVIFCAAPFERQLDEPGRLEALPWHRLYERVADLAGLRPGVRCTAPDVELVPFGHGRRVLAVNHRASAVRATIRWTDPPARRTVRLNGKAWRLIDAGGDHHAGGGV